MLFINIERSTFTLQERIQIDSARPRDMLQGLGFVLRWSFGSLPHCLLFGRVGLSVNCWDCWVVRGRQLTQKTHLSTCEWDRMTLSLVWRSRFPSTCLLDNVSKTHSPNWRAGNPPIRKLASGEIFSDSALLWETAVCFLHIHQHGTNVCDPNTHNTPLTLILNLACHLQMKRPGINQNCYLQSASHTRELSVNLCLIDVIDQDSVQEPCRCHLRRWSTLLCECCFASFFVFDVVSPEHDSPLVLLEVFCKFGVLQVTEVHQVRDVDCCSIFLRLTDDFRVGFCNCSPSSSTATLASGTFKASWT